MKWYYILLIIIGSLLLLNILITLITSYVSYRLTFYVNRKKEYDDNELPFEEYAKYKDAIINRMNLAKNSKYEDFYIKSFDGLKLHAMYFESIPGAPIEILVHGYRGSAFRDMAPGIDRAKAVGRNAFLIDQRTSGKSEGHTITFGINERHDVISWINFIIEHFGKDVEIYLGGVSMGGSTVLLTSNMNLPENVKGILADSSFYSAKEIIKKVVKDMKLPPNLMYPFIKLGAKLFGKFNLEEATPIEAVKNTKIPIIFYHGDADSFVPLEMSAKLFMACNSKSKFIIIPDAVHAICYLVDPLKYENELKDFINR